MLQFPTLLELATRQVPCLDISQSIAQASNLLAQARDGFLVLLHADKPVGVLSAADILDALNHGASPSDTLDQIPLPMPAVPCLPANANWQDAMRNLLEPSAKGILLIVNASGEFEGILSEADFCRRLGIRQLSGTHRMLAALDDSELKLDALFDTPLIFLCLLTPDGLVLDANHAALQVMGGALRDVAGLPFWKVPWWRHDTHLQAQVRDAVHLAQQGLASGFKASHCAQDGSVLMVDFTMHPIRDPSGVVHYLLPESIDITERCRAEAALHASQSHNHALLNATSVGVLEMDQGGRCIYVNRKFTEISGLSLAQALGDGWMQGIQADDLNKLLQVRIRAKTYGFSGSIEYHYTQADGRITWVISQLAPMIGANGKVSGMIMTLIDITERKEMETRLFLAASIFEVCSEGILVVDAQNHIISVNPAFTALLGYEAADVLGRDPCELGSARNAPSLYKTLWQAVEENGHWQGEIWNCCKNGQEVALWMTVNTLCNRNGEVQWRFALFSDITERKRSDELIWRQANFDMLTGLPNRRLFRDRLQQEIKKAARANQRLALLFIDLDRFKEVNDSFGHDCGDQLLIEAGDRICRCLRETDTVARLGGDEFTAVLPDMNELSRVEEAAVAIIQALAMPFVIDGHEASVSASVGIAFYPQDACTDLALLKQADLAMYAAKAKGRNCFSVVTAQGSSPPD